MANIAKAPNSFILVINRTIQPGNAARTTDKLGPKDVTSGGGPSIPTSGVIWWPRK